MSVTNKAVLGRLDRVINAVLFLRKKDVFRFQGVTLYPAEVHLLLFAAARPQSNLTDMAKGLGVTKGAVSQTLTRLVDKGVVLKSKDPGNKNALSLELTDFGAEALRRYQDLTQALGARLSEHLDEYTDVEKRAIKRFLGQVAALFQEWK